MSVSFCLKVGLRLSSQWLFRGLYLFVIALVNLSGSGVLLHKFVSQYDALPLIMPVTSALAGNVGCLFAARLATDFHRNVEENTSLRSQDNVIAMGSLFCISLPIYLAFLGFIHLLGAFKFDFLFLIAYLITGILSVPTTRL